jgi:hypothetical protein
LQNFQFIWIELLDIVRLLPDEGTCGLAARNDRLEKEVILLLNERDEVGVTGHLNDQDLRPGAKRVTRR